MTQEELIKELELLADSCDSNYALEVNGYSRGVLDALDVVNKYFVLAPVGGSGFTRLELGEAWMWCSDCMSKLYSFDGSEDSSRKCPHPQKCEDDRNRTKNHYR